jgi:hypothetical protein
LDFKASCVAALKELVAFKADIRIVRAATCVSLSVTKGGVVAATVVLVELLVYITATLLADFRVAVETGLVTAAPKSVNSR